MTDHARGCEGRSYTCTCGYDAERDAAIAALKGEIERLRTCGMAELAALNPNAMSYVSEWEARATAAEARLAEACRVLHEFERYVALNAYDQWLPEGHAKTSVLSRHLDAARAWYEKENRNG